MPKYMILWSLSDCGREVVEADSDDEACEKFRMISLNELCGYDEGNLATIGLIYEIKTAKEGGGGE